MMKGIRSMRMNTFNHQRGSFILEALVSIVIFAVGMIALMGMSAQAVNQIGQTKYRNDASYLAEELIGQLWVSASTPSTFDYDAWTDKVAATLPEGAAVIGDAPVDGDAEYPMQCKDPAGTGKPTGSRVCIRITWADKQGDEHFYVTTTQIVKN